MVGLCGLDKSVCIESIKFSYTGRCNKSKLGDECYVGNISNYTDRILETSTYLRFFLHYKVEDIIQPKHKNHM